MKANELMLGNYLISFGDGEQDPNEQIITVNQLAKEEYRTYINNCPDDFFKPIPLTKEWLLKFGFEQSQVDNYQINCSVNDRYTVIDVNIEDEICIDIYTNNEKWQVGCWANTKNKHVHQLQNLYYALCQKELSIVEIG